MPKTLVASLILLAAAAQYAHAAPAQDDTDRLPEHKGLASRLSDSIHQATDRAGDVIRNAMGALGVPYRRGGTSAETGFDCSGFANFIYNQYGFKTAGPSHELALMGVPKDRQQLQAGDLVFFGNEERISHVGIVTSGANGRIGFIHSSTSGGIRTDEVVGNEYWEKRYLFGRDLISGFMAAK